MYTNYDTTMPTGTQKMTPTTPIHSVINSIEIENYQLALEKVNTGGLLITIIDKNAPI